MGVKPTSLAVLKKAIKQNSAAGGCWLYSRCLGAKSVGPADTECARRSARSTRCASTLFVGSECRRRCLTSVLPDRRRSATDGADAGVPVRSSSSTSGRRRAAAAGPATRTPADGDRGDDYARDAGAHRVANDRTQPGSEGTPASPGTTPGTEGSQDTERHSVGVYHHLDSLQRLRHRANVLPRLHPPAPLRVRSVEQKTRLLHFYFRNKFCIIIIIMFFDL